MTPYDLTQEMAASAMRSLAIKELVDFLTPLVRQPKDSPRQARDKVRQRLMYAVKNGDPDALAAIGAESDFRVDIERAMAWAKAKWPQIALGPARHVPAPLAPGFKMGDGARNRVIPGDLARCQAALESAYKELRHMHADLESAYREIAQLTPPARRYLEICEANRKSAQIRRGSR